MTNTSKDLTPYGRLLSPKRIRKSKIEGRSLDEEADADRGRVLFSAPFRRLQNKAQVFSLETNAAVRSRLTHSLEVSSIGRLVSQEALKALSSQAEALGIAGKERALITFVETACLLHDLGNPPFGHFGEVAISHWFHKNDQLVPDKIGGNNSTEWAQQYADFLYFDGNPQGLRICTRLQPSKNDDLSGMNLTVTTLAAIIKYPWDSTQVGAKQAGGLGKAKKSGYFHSESNVLEAIQKHTGVKPARRHPLVYLMEAADDIAYCVSDIEDGIEKNLITASEFSDFMKGKLESGAFADEVRQANMKHDDDEQRRYNDAKVVADSGGQMTSEDGVERATALRDFRSAVIRYLAHCAGLCYAKQHEAVLEGEAAPLLRDGPASQLLLALKDFAELKLYSSTIVRNREITAQAVLCGLLDAHRAMIECDYDRFCQILAGKRRDRAGRPIGRESSLAARISPKYLAVYRAALAETGLTPTDDGPSLVKERILRIRLIVDHITGMTDEYALQSFQLVSGVHINPYRT